MQPSLDVAVSGRFFHHGLGPFPGPVVYVGRRVEGHRGLEVLPAGPQSRPQVLLEPPVAGRSGAQDDRIDLVEAGLSGLFLLVTDPAAIAVAVPGGLPGRLVPPVGFPELQREFVPHRHEDFRYHGEPLELGHSGGDVPGPGLPAAGCRILQVQPPPDHRLFPCDRAFHVGLSLSARAVSGRWQDSSPVPAPGAAARLRGRPRDSWHDGFHNPFVSMS